jgi:carboxyl-terminal processing protease
LRFLLAAAIVAAASLGGAAYVNRAAAGDVAVASTSGGTQIAGIDLSALTFGGGSPDRRMLAMAFEQVEHNYYQPVDDQTLLTGEHKALIALLTLRHVAHAKLAPVIASGDESHDLSLAENAVTAATSAYPHAATTDEYTQYAIRGLLASLKDPYTTYLSKTEIAGLEEQLNGGNFGGIGVYIARDPRNGRILVDPIEGNPAIRAGLRPGDAIVAVDDHATTGDQLDDVERLIRGPLGTTVRLRIRRHDSTVEQTVAVVRAQVHVPSVRAKMENGIEYIRLADFGETSADEVRAALLDGKKQHARGYILDLRNNGGGLLDAAVDISSLFIPEGTIVSTIDRAGHKESRSANGRFIGSTPLVLLVNKYTASASEITAGAVQDDHVGTLVGTKTFGKGVVQSLYNLPDHAALKITTARYVTPAGRDIQHKGIVPDVVVDQRVDVPIIDTASDKQLAAAKAIIRTKDAQ